VIFTPLSPNYLFIDIARICPFSRADPSAPTSEIFLPLLFQEVTAFEQKKLRKLQKRNHNICGVRLDCGSEVL
jgi:hypothetical protein